MCVCVWVQGNEVSSGSARPVSVGEVVDNGRVLTISSLTETLLGNYSCTATNIRGTDARIVPVFGPPPPPFGVPEVDRNGNQFTISWSRPSSPNVIITGYKVNLYMLVQYSFLDT